ncbi:NUDIX hydrolase [Zhouia sp. PK063]|uniref:NUDIX hydrolase n=1 Tax=Zhouia sp. PK063 TaxID=3373602 RepID=UPI0037A8480E
MNFDNFSDSISKIIKLQLPGQIAHYKMAPLERITALSEINIEARKPRNAAVLLLFYPDAAQQTKFVLTLRHTYKGVHSNQVGLPGGKEERYDISLEATALRETTEEIGVPSENIKVHKALTEVYIPPSNFRVFPFLGTVNYQPEFIPQDAEVAQIIETNLDDFLDDKSVVSRELTTSYAAKIHVPAFSLNGFTVWGATAMMLSEVKELLKQVI